MYPCAKPNPDKNNTKMYSSQETDLAEKALMAPATISIRILPAPMRVAVESIPALDILVYQYKISRTTIGGPRMTSLVVSQQRCDR